MAADTTAAPAATAATVVHARSTVRPDKAEAVAEMAQAFRDSAAAVLTEYRGLTVQQITALRLALGADTTYSVVKNTLTKLAAADAGLTGLDELLAGPTAVAFIGGDPVEAAKGLRDYARANPALIVKGGILDGKALTADEVRKLADLESREVLLAKLAGAMTASLSQAVYLLNAPLAQAARLAGALLAKAQEDPSILRGGAGTPAEDTAVASGGEASDAPLDAAVDAPVDATSDVPVDTAVDAPVDATSDVPVDAPVEEGAAPPIDAVGEAPVEEAVDVAAETPDTSPEIPTETSTEIPTDSSTA